MMIGASIPSSACGEFEDSSRGTDACLRDEASPVESTGTRFSVSTGCRSSSSGNWSRSVVTGILLCLVALENALLAADRLQFLSDERDELEQLADVEPRAILEMELGR